MYFVYILHSESKDRFYIGQTGDLDDRLTRHNDGKSTSTKYGVPWKLVYTEGFETRAASLAREKEIKGWKIFQKNPGTSRRSYRLAGQDVRGTRLAIPSFRIASRNLQYNYRPESEPGH